MRRLKPIHQTSPNRRPGAALMEVLIAILAMGIGVVSLMSLFPLSVLRTAQSHQLTVGTGVRLNVEAVIDSYPYAWIDPDRDGNGDPPPGQESFLIDPLGAIRVPPPANTAVGDLERFHLGYDDEAEAKGLVVYSGNWVTRVENIATAQVLPGPLPPPPLPAGPIGVTVPGIVAQNITNSIDVRAVLFSADGKQSHLRRLDDPGVLTDTITWTDPLPTNYTVGNVRIESKEEQFTWLLSVQRRDSAAEYTADLNAAIFFRREFSEESERVYPVTTIPANAAAVPPTPERYEISYATLPRPAIRRNGYLLDSVNGLWYRVSDYVEDTTTSKLTISLEYHPAPPLTQAVFFRGLVDVYPLGTRQVKK